MTKEFNQFLPFWHKKSYDQFIQEQLPQLLGERLPLVGYGVEPIDTYHNQITVTVAGTLANNVTVVYRDVPQPDEQGIFKINDKLWTVVPRAEHEAVDSAEILCVGDMLYTFCDENLGVAPPELDWDEQLLRSWLPLDRWLRERFEGPAQFRYDLHFQYVDGTNWLSTLSHARRLFIANRRAFIAPGQMGRTCPFETPEGPNIARIFSIAVGAAIQDNRLVIEDHRLEKGLGLSATLVPCLEHNDPARLLMGTNMMRQWLPYEQPEPALVQSGYEPNVTGVWTGRNLLTAFIPWGVETYEAGIIISESGAAKLSDPQYGAELGDKLSNRHGTKGVITRIVPDAEMPQMTDGTPIELIVSSSDMLSRMVLGQIREAILGRLAHAKGEPLLIPPFHTPSTDEIRQWLAEHKLPEDGQEQLLDPKTGRTLTERSTVGWVYWGYLNHRVRDKLQFAAYTISGAQRVSALDFNVLKSIGAYETVRGFYHSQAALSSPDEIREPIDIEQADPPTLLWLALQQRLLAVGIEMRLVDQRLTFGFLSEDQLGLQLARPVRHPWLHERQLTALGTLPEHLTPMSEYDALLQANAKVAQLQQGSAPQSLLTQALEQLQTSVDAYLDSLLNAAHLQFENRVLFSGRTVVIPTGDLAHDQIGIPEEMAWAFFGPQLAQELDEDAVEKRTDAAAQRLDALMAQSWIIVNRSPSVTETAFLAFYPVRVPSKTIQIHPLLCPLLDADFDGDQAALFLPLTEAGQREAGERLSLVGHLQRNRALLAKMMPRHEALWGLALLSQSEAGHREIEEIVGMAINTPDGFITHMTLLETMEQVLDNSGPQSTLDVITALMKRGFEEARQSGFSISPFIHEDVVGKIIPDQDDPALWEPAARQQTERFAAAKVNEPHLQSHLLSIKSGARGEASTLNRIIGPQGVATNIKGDSVIIRHGYSHGLTAEQLYALVPSARQRLSDIAMQWVALEKPSASAASHTHRSFHVLARARRTDQPGIVFARAAAIGEVDLLVDEVSRLFVGV